MTAYAISHPYALPKRRAISVRWNSILPWLSHNSAKLGMGVCLLGISIPLLMLLNLIPLTFGLAFIGLVLTSTGGMVSIIRCGDLC